MIAKIRCAYHVWLILGFIFLTCQSSLAQERLCDPAFEDCYSPLLQAVNAETAGIDMAFYWIELPELADAIIRRHQAGVPVRLIVEPRASLKITGNQVLLDRFRAAGIPMRYKLGDGIVHAKMLLLAGQNKVVFSSSNFGDGDVRPFTPYVNYVDGAWYFTIDQALVNSFKTRYDDIWTNTLVYGNYANIFNALTRSYPTYPIDPSLNFLPNSNPAEDYGTRTIALIDQEHQRIDLSMYRLTEARICDALIRAVARGVPVRLLAEPLEYRFDTSRIGAELTGPYNVDRLYAAGVQIKMRRHSGLMHQKTIQFYGQGITVFGSSNWSWQSFNYQEEHNYFTSKTWFFQWFAEQFNRRWESPSEFESFVPQAPTAPVNLSPANGSTVGQPVQLTWEGGRWAHKYDVYLGTNENNLSLIAADVFTGTLGTNGAESYQLFALQTDTTYCWRVTGKTMADQPAVGPTSCFRTSATTNPVSGPMQLILDATGPAADQVASLDSRLLFRDPFPVMSGMSLMDAGGDHNTRVVVFMRNLQWAPDQPSSVVVNLIDEASQSFDVPAEAVRIVLNTDLVQVIFRLPDNLSPGTCTLKIRAHGQTSNAGTMRIRN